MTGRTITAIPAGRDRHGKPLARRTYVIDRDPEDWGDGRSRIFGVLPLPGSPAARTEELRRERRSTGPLAIVLTDSIRPAIEYRVQRIGHGARRWAVLRNGETLQHFREQGSARNAAQRWSNYLEIMGEESASVVMLLSMPEAGR